MNAYNTYIYLMLFSIVLACNTILWFISEESFKATEHRKSIYFINMEPVDLRN